MGAAQTLISKFRVSRPLWVFFYDLLLFIMEVN